MRKDAIQLEEKRLQEINTIEDYQSLHERHRIFPQVFENRQIKKVLDVASGVGVVGKNIREKSDIEPYCNDICPKCLKTMKKIGLKTVSFDIDDNDRPFPFEDGYFDAVIALATIEHVLHIDHFVQEIYRIVKDGGYFFISAPNYSGLPYLMPFLITGKTFHDPMSDDSRYEFYSHIRYFTYQTLLDFVRSFGFMPETVYVPLPKSGSRYQTLKNRSPLKAAAIRMLMKIAYSFSPRWAAEPVICFQKLRNNGNGTVRKVLI